MKTTVVWLVMCIVGAAGLSAQPSIQASGNIETAEQLVSTQAQGTAPLEVTSTTVVSNLNADLLDGNTSTDFADATATAEEFQDLEDQITLVQSQVNALGLAKLPRTGQSEVFAVGDDGHLQLGVAWPSPRFSANGDGTVLDNLTGLIWLANTNCTDDFGSIDKSGGQLVWEAALTWSNALEDLAMDDCGLSDGSVPGEWRLPNLRELQSLVHYGVVNPAVPNAAGTGQCLNDAACAFSGVANSMYWSSSTLAINSGLAWFVNMNNGYVFHENKTIINYVWPVRGGQ